MNSPMKTPLLELLDAVPSDARVVVEMENSARFYAVGRLCREAAARIRELEQWKQSVIDGLMVAEIYQDKHESDPKAALNALIDWYVAVEAHGHSENTKAALKLNEILTAQIAAHEAVCAGVWIPVRERLPELKILDDKPVKNPIGIGLLPVLKRSGKIVCRSGPTLYVDELLANQGGEDKPVWNLGRGRNYTHWLDAREPKRSTTWNEWGYE